MIELPNGWRVDKTADEARYRVLNGQGRVVGYVEYRDVGYYAETWVLHPLGVGGYRIFGRASALGPDWADVEKNLQPTLAALIVRGEL